MEPLRRVKPRRKTNGALRWAWTVSAGRSAIVPFGFDMFTPLIMIEYS